MPNPKGGMRSNARPAKASTAWRSCPKRLIGQSEADLVKPLNDFRAAVRENDLMSLLIANLSDNSRLPQVPSKA
jgi:cytochrome c553